MVIEDGNPNLFASLHACGEERQLKAEVVGQRMRNHSYPLHRLTGLDCDSDECWPRMVVR